MLLSILFFIFADFADVGCFLLLGQLYVQPTLQKQVLGVMFWFFTHSLDAIYYIC